MSEQQIIETAEATRQFPRYRIPAFLEIEGQRYRLRDWSLGGCAIEKPSEALLKKPYLKASFICPFEDFELVIKDLNLQPLEKRDEILAARFEGLRPEQIALFKEIINAYLEGTLEVLPEKFINAIRREDLRAAVEARRPLPPPEGKLKILKQIFIFCFLIIIFLILIFFFWFSLKDRVFTVKAISAHIAGKVHVLRSPVTGYFEPIRAWKSGETIKKGELIGYVKSPSLGSVLLKSFFEGQILSWGKSLPVVREGDPILYLIPPNTSPYIKAIVLHEETTYLRVGQKVIIRDIHGNTFSGKIQKILAGEGTYFQDLSSRTLSRAPDFDFLVIVPEKPLPITRIGEAVQVRIPVSPNFLKKLKRTFQLFLK